MYGTLRYEMRIRRPAADVWRLAGDPARLHEWFPGMVGCDVDGTRRTVHLASGVSFPEEILTVDDVQRRFQYRLGLPILRHHTGTIDVIDLGDETSLVVYATDADPRTLALVIAGGTAGALDELKRLMESGFDPATVPTDPGAM